MVRNPVLYKSLVIGIVILFVGIAFQPAVAVDTNISESKDDCDLCPKKVSKSHLALIKSSLNRLEKYDNQISALSELNPEIDEKYDKINDRITSITKVTERFISALSWNLPIACGILTIIKTSFLVLAIIYLSFMWTLEDLGLWEFDMLSLSYTIFLCICNLHIFALLFGVIFGCWDMPEWPEPPPHIDNGLIEIYSNINRS